MIEIICKMMGVDESQFSKDLADAILSSLTLDKVKMKQIISDIVEEGIVDMRSTEEIIDTQVVALVSADLIRIKEKE